MTELEVCRLSAEAINPDRLRYEPDRELVWDWLNMKPWNPRTDAEQRWECVEWLLKRGLKIELVRGGAWIEKPDFIYSTRRPASEFPACAVAELHKRSKDG